MINQAVKLLKEAKKIFILTGAGISAESGVPTFRGKDGLWKNYSATDLATPEAFNRNPELVWEWYRWRQDIISRANPNPAHYALVDLENHFEGFLLLTQNVDNLHQRAGSKNVLELHGNIFRTRCLKCGRIDNIENARFEKLPYCKCGGLLRPDVVWFGESIPQDVWQKSMGFLSSADVAIICGTSGVVWPAAAIPEIAGNYGVKTIEINLESTPVTPVVDISILSPAGKTLPEIVKSLLCHS
uniref:NAD-dependent protein deacylase n=1 Tax=candidate division WOR-3 bacterium TaxID=2052148 RepID=A0A7V0Z3Z3_UNCW3